MTPCKICGGPVEPWRIPYGHKGCRDCEIRHWAPMALQNELDWLQVQASHEVHAALRQGPYEGDYDDS